MNACTRVWYSTGFLHCCLVKNPNQGTGAPTLIKAIKTISHRQPIGQPALHSSSLSLCQGGSKLCQIHTQEILDFITSVWKILFWNSIFASPLPSRTGQRHFACREQKKMTDSALVKQCGTKGSSQLHLVIQRLVYSFWLFVSLLLDPLSHFISDNLT